MSILYELDTPIILGHRGASKHAPENTLSSFELAIAHGADGFELDVKLTSDNIPVVMHDINVERTTSGTGKVSKNTLKEIKSVDAGVKFGEAFAGEKIPSLSDVFETFNKSILINVELTNYNTPFDDLVAKVVELIKHHNNMDQILISSFLPHNLFNIKRCLPEVPVALLAYPNMIGYIQRSKILQWVSPMIIHPNKSNVDLGYITKQHKKNRRVHTWTVNDPLEIQKLIQYDVDGIITDDPKLAKQLLTKEVVEQKIYL